MALGKGFEPLVPVSRDNCLAGSRYRPLSQPNKYQEIDIKNAKQNIGNAGFTYEEREKFTELLKSGFIDTYRYYNKDKKDAYSWWSYRKGVREKNIGWRIDYFLVSQRIIEKVEKTIIYSDVYGSDHCPIGITYNP